MLKALDVVFCRTLVGFELLVAEADADVDQSVEAKLVRFDEATVTGKLAFKEAVGCLDELGTSTLFCANIEETDCRGGSEDLLGVDRGHFGESQ